ncbi:E3 ubiquitin-protein ligase RING1-like protein, partial [Cucurbita argyrosperma subsp. sororia]
MSFAASTPIQYRLYTAAAQSETHKALEVRMRSFNRLISASSFPGVPPQILFETRPTPVNDALFHLSLRQLHDPLFHIPRLLSTLHIHAAACEVIGWKIASQIAQLSAGNRETSFHIVVEVDFIQNIWMGQVAGMHQGQGNGGGLVEETLVLDELPARRRQRRGVVARVEVEEEKELGDCCICLDEMMNKKREVIRTPCGHVYHESCIFQWLNLHNSCPLCKRPLPLEEDST